MGLNVGDSLPLSLYEDDPGLPPIYARFQESCNPRRLCSCPRSFRQEMEYTIIGLYRQSSEWVTTPTSFTPNSVFVPEKSVTCQTVTGNYGVWSSLILQNGTIDQMEARLEENDLGGAVTYYDQGYSDIVESLDATPGCPGRCFWWAWPCGRWCWRRTAYCFPCRRAKPPCVCGHWARKSETL
mgnify:CR=1 FL=1